MGNDGELQYMERFLHFCDNEQALSVTSKSYQVAQKGGKPKNGYEVWR